MANLKLEYGSSSSLTCTLASLASSSSLVAGRQSNAYDNSDSANKFLDLLVAGLVTTGTSPTAGTIEVWAVAAENDTPSWPDGFGASDASITVSSRDMLVSYGRLVAAMTTDTTSNRGYSFAPTSLAALFGALPKRVALFVVHNTVAALNSTGSNHRLSVTPVYMTST